MLNWYSIGVSSILPLTTFNLFRKSLTQTWLNSSEAQSSATYNSGPKVCHPRSQHSFSTLLTEETSFLLPIIFFLFFIIFKTGRKSDLMWKMNPFLLSCFLNYGNTENLGSKFDIKNWEDKFFEKWIELNWKIIEFLTLLENFAQVIA